MKTNARVRWGALVAGILLIPAAASAQMGVAILGGVSIATLEGDDAQDEAGNDLGSRTGLHFCASLDVPLAGKGVDIGALFGAGLSFPVRERVSILVNGGLDLGLASIDDSPADADIKNFAWLLNAGVAFGVGR